MALIGRFANWHIIVLTHDSANTPLFYITRSIDSNECYLGINIKSPEYHNCSDCTECLKDKEKRQLIEFLNGTDKWDESNWIVLLKAWNRNNPDREIPLNTTMPDYSKLK